MNHTLQCVSVAVSRRFKHDLIGTYIVTITERVCDNEIRTACMQVLQEAP